VLILVIGQLGSGKTLFLTIYSFLTSKSKVLANFKIKNKKVKDLSIKDLFDNNLKDVCILIDEAYTLIESRASMSDINRFMSYILFQSRKRSIDILMTAQLFSTIDVRFRKLTDYIVYCQNFTKKHLFVYKIYNQKHLLKTIRLHYFNAIEFFDKYDTNQIILPRNNDILFDYTNKEDMIKELEKMSDEYMNDQLFSKKVTQANVKAFLVLNGYSKKYTDLLYAYLKRLENK